MKLVVIGPVYPYRGGIAHYTTLLIQNLVSAGHEVKVISFRRQYVSWLYPGKTDKDTSLKQMKVPASFLLSPLQPWTWAQTARQVLREKPDLVILQWWTTFWAPAYGVLARLVRCAGVPALYLVHNVMPHEPRFWDRWLAFFALSAGQHYLVQTTKEAQRLRALIPRASAAVVSHPVYAMFSGERISREDARARLHLPAGEKVLLFFGIVRPYKGLGYLLDALHLLKQSGKTAHLIIAGEFWEPEARYRSQIEQLGLRDQVHIYNYYIPNEEIPAIFCAADVFVAPYIDGTQSGAVKMALGFDLPIILTHCISDDMLAGQPGVWTVAERDPTALAEAINEACQEPERTKSPLPGGDGWDRIVAEIEAICADARKRPVFLGGSEGNDEDRN